MEYIVTIDQFEGPMDLLLHMVKKADIEINEIKVADITQQYIDYIKAMENLSLEIASEYLIMAAILINIKSKKLLPLGVLDFGDEEDDFDIRSEADLKKRLIEYQAHKESTDHLRLLEEQRAGMLSKTPTELELPKDFVPKLKEGTDVYDLLGAFNKVLARFQVSKPVVATVQASKYSVEDRLADLKLYVKEHREFLFSSLFLHERSREYIVTTFFALLVLARIHMIDLKQDENFEDFIVTLNENYSEENSQSDSDFIEENMIS